MKKFAIGIDIGSTCAKAAVLDEKKDLKEKLLLPTGWSSADTAEEIRRRLASYIEEGTVVATGYGRVCVPYADKSVTEITCHGKGAD